MGTTKENDIDNNKPSTKSITIGTPKREETNPNPNNKSNHNNIKGEDDERNCLIGPKGGLQSAESRVTNNVISRTYVIILVL